MLLSKRLDTFIPLEYQTTLLIPRGGICKCTRGASCMALISHRHSCLTCYIQVKNEVVIWDRIVRRKEDAFIKFAGKNKYMFRDISSSFKCVVSLCFESIHAYTLSLRNVPPANYSLKYNVMPYVGMLTTGEAARTSEPIAFPPTQSRLQISMTIDTFVFISGMQS